MRSPWEPPYYPLSIKVNNEGTAFTGTFDNGQTVSTALGTGASIVNGTIPDGSSSNGVKAVNTGNGGEGDAQSMMGRMTVRTKRDTMKKCQ